MRTASDGAQQLARLSRSLSAALPFGRRLHAPLRARGMRRTRWSSGGERTILAPPAVGSESADASVRRAAERVPPPPPSSGPTAISLRRSRMVMMCSLCSTVMILWTSPTPPPLSDCASDSGGTAADDIRAPYVSTRALSTGVSCFMPDSQLHASSTFPIAPWSRGPFKN
eukprot:SAG11_NODE_2033_length_3899_cov_2.298421_5_plen_170_part_00